MKLILTRHGETEENKKEIIQGHLHGKLSKLGREQAKKVALRLKNEKIDYIYSSDLARASETAKEIHRFHKNIPIKFVKELRERNLGEFEGKTKSELKQKGKEITFLQPKKGESIKKVCTRGKNFLYEIFKKHSKDAILFVGHNGINKAIISCIIGKEINEIEKQHNTSVNIFEISDDKKHRIHLLNCIEHLK